MTNASPRTPIDPRGPRFGAAITAVLLLVAVGLALIGGTPAALTERLVQPAFLLFAFIVLVFAWGAFAGVGRHPYGWLYRRLVRPRLGAPAELENPVPPTFAQGIGLVVTAVGLLLFLVGVPYALVVTGSLAFIAAFLNSVFDYCVGCQIYLLLVRTGVLGRRTTPVAP
ncbi:hypothetical protein B7R54_08325 [Subtercola boreus]|uniref:DUF4395 domain-containing protein n=1 Tax=Subtercola boreus TaxID=120213 RepID=A0A3E0VIL0_9MICO|nr:DUF4395 domain-containing protein [Subtercola boreus]RFA09230.1 hypothetical protein B7R54_08325 [Subtercola boreus]TQL53745.1 uncharacterized protein DUF4395 [Subtercola boreus]